MPRRNRTQSSPCCYHVTHRCQERRFLFRFELDRKNYLHRLRQMQARYGVSVLDYIVTCNHVHLLLWGRHARDVSAGMHFLQGASSRDYNRRKGREGAFWRGRYHPTLIESGPHLSRCLLYIDLNMVRAGVVAHPRDWRASGFHELCGKRQRYRVVDLDRLLLCLGMPEQESGFRAWYAATLERMIRERQLVREGVWSEAAAIGSRRWLTGVSAGTGGGAAASTLSLIQPPTDSGARGGEPVYAIQMSERKRRHFWSDRHKSR